MNMDILAEAKRVFEIEKQSLDEAVCSLDDGFVRLIEDIRSCKGRVIVAGMGKAGHVGAKIAATMASLGTSAFFLHPAEALHGNLGQIAANDMVLLFSKSGESEEVNKMLPSIGKIGAKTVAITCCETSFLSQSCDYHIRLRITEEASAHKIAPTSSTTVMMVFGDALAVCLEKLSGFTPDNYAVFHPGGVLGKRLVFTVADIMARGETIPYVLDSATIKDAIVEMSSKSVIGGVAVVDDNHTLLGILTDGDVRRLLQSLDNIAVLSKSISDIMTHNPITLTKNVKAIDALRLMENPDRTIGIIPIVDGEKRLIGMLSIHDLIKAGF